MDDQCCNAEDVPIVSQPLGDSEFIPKYGMEFDSEEKAYQFYNAYGFKSGFSVRREYANKHRTSGEITSRLFVCCKEGYRGKDKRDRLTKNPRAETRTGCGALMHIKLDRNKGKFWVNKFVELHNHPMVKEECAHMLPSQRRIFKPLAIDVNEGTEQDSSGRDRDLKNEGTQNSSGRGREARLDPKNEGTVEDFSGCGREVDLDPKIEGTIQDFSGCGREVHLDPKLEIAHRYRKLCRIYEPICFMAAQSEETYNLALDYAVKLEKIIRDMRKRKVDELEDRNSSCQ